MLPKRLVLFVEGKGDTAAVPALARRVLSATAGNDALFVDADPFRVSGIGALVKNRCTDWHRWLRAAGRTRSNVGAMLLVLDGDIGRVPSTWQTYAQRYGSPEFCAYRVAAMLAEEARSSRAGEAFSLAVVFAMKEFESWLLAGVESLRGQTLAEGRVVVPADATCPAIDVEAKRDAKGLLRELIGEYDQSLDQAVLAANVDPALVGQRCKSFRRFQHAVGQLVSATRAAKPIVSPII